MKSTRTTLLIIAAAVVLLGVVMFLLQPGEPEGECVPEGAPSSGFVDESSGCAISQESFEEIRDYEESPKPFRIAGLGLVVVGLGVGGFALTRKKGPGTPTT